MKRIESIQALRGYAILGIFLSHSKFFISWSALGVSVFFVISGFLMMYKYEQTCFEKSFINNLFFAQKKILKLYPLHIITMVYAIALAIVEAYARQTFSFKWLVNLAGEAVYNLSLMQSWVPDVHINTSLSGVAWYLSVMLFLYFIFPNLKEFVERKSIVLLCILSGVIIIVEVISCACFIIFGLHKSIYVWFMYCFPVFRIGDFYFGCVLKRVLFESKIKNISSLLATLFEILTLVLTVLVYIFARNNYHNPVLLALNNNTTIYIPLAFLWVMAFALKKGILTKILCNKLAYMLGNISSYFFLIHYLVVRTINFVLYGRQISENYGGGADNCINNYRFYNISFFVCFI